MSFTTTPCHISTPQEPNFSSLLSHHHPALSFLATYQTRFSAPDHEMFSLPYTDFHTADFEYVDASGVSYTGEKAWEKRKEIYERFFDGHRVEPTYGHVSELGVEGDEGGGDGKGRKGWVMLGEAWLFGRFKGDGGGGTKVKDGEGGEWDLKVPTCLHMEFVEDAGGPEGLKMSKLRLFCNSLPIMVEAIKKGLVPKETVLGGS